MERKHYEGREQAWVKHCVLRNYLEQLAFKVGQFRRGTTLNYIDCFSGPWDAVGEGWKDSSPYIATAELEKARGILSGLAKPVTLNVRAMFVEREPAAFARLEELCRGLEDIEVAAHHGSFEDLVGEAVRFAQGGTNPFAFVFIDPTGWTGYGLERITPLLRVDPSEVLINFMTKDIIRFIDDEDSTAVASFVDLFGDARYREAWRGLEGLEREEAIVSTYGARIREAGGFRHVVSAVVLNPEKDRTHYHLVYATRSDVGLITFREIESKAMREQQRMRADRKRSKAAPGQELLFEPTELDRCLQDHVVRLGARYRGQAGQRMEDRIRRDGTVEYDHLLLDALRSPMMAERDVKAWIKEQLEARRLQILGLDSPRKSVPRFGHGHRVQWVTHVGL